MQPERPASRGAQFFGFPAQEGYSGSEAQAPDSWRILFAESADADVLWGLLCSCRTGRDLILQTAPKAKLRLGGTAELPAAAWQRRLEAVRQALLSRGTKPTKLAFTVGTDSLPALLVAAVLTREPAPALSELRLRAAYAQDRAPIARTITGLLLCTLPTLTNLRSLSIKGAIPTLPPPTQLKHLTALKIRIYPAYEPSQEDMTNIQDMCKSIGAYLPQLQALHLNGPNWPVDMDDNDGEFKLIPWPTLFTPATTTTTLTHFSCDERLTGQLLGLLLAHAPALKHLGVWCVDLGTDEYRQRVWGVETLTMLGSLDSRNDLQHLPTARSLSINVPRVWLDITSAQGMNALMCERLQEWCFKVKGQLRVGPGWDFPAVDHPTALLAALQQLRGLRLQPASAAVLQLDNWHWSAAMGEPAAAALSQLTQLQVTIELPYNAPTTTDALTALLQIAPHVSSVHVSELGLQSDQHASAPWPDTKVSFLEVDLAQMLNFPHPGGQGVRRVESILMILNNYIYQADVQRLHDVLQHIEWTTWRGGHILTLSCTQERYQGRSLRSQLSVLPALRFADPPPLPAQPPPPARAFHHLHPEVRLKGWACTDKVLTALSDLPTWGRVLRIREPFTEALDGNACTLLASHVPTCYTEWCFYSLSEAQVDGLCAALNQRRAGLGLGEPLQLYVSTMEGQERMVGEHVLLVPGRRVWG